MFWDLCSCCWHSTSHEKHFIWKHADVFAQPLLYKFILSSPSLSGGFSFSSWMGVTWFYHLSQLQLPLLGQLFPRLSAWCPAMLFCTLLHLCFLSVNGSPVFQTCSWNRCSPFFFFPLHIFLCREHSWLLAAHSHSRELPTHHFIWNPVTFPVAPLRYSMLHFWCKCFSHHSCVHQPLSWLTFPAAPSSALTPFAASHPWTRQ